MTIQERLNAQKERAGQIEALATQAQGRDFTEAEQRQFDDLNTQYDNEKIAIDREASRSARLSEIRADGERSFGLPNGASNVPASGVQDRGSAITDSALNAALRGWAAGPEARSEDVQTARRLGINLDSNKIEIRLNGRQPVTGREAHEQSRAMNPLVGAQGGFLVVPQFSGSFEEAMLEYDDMRGFVDVLRTETGAELSWPGGDDTAISGEWLAVGQEVSNQDLTASKQTWSAHTVSSKSVKVDRTLLQDASYDLVGRISRSLGTRIGRAMAAAHTTGSGVGQPTGIVNSAYLGKTAAATGSFTFDEVMDLISSVGTAYAKNAKFMMHRLIKWEMRKKKDGQGRYLWEPQLQTAGQPDNILGYQIIENSNMSSALTTGQKLILFGDLSHYKIRDVASITIQRLVEKYAETNQDAFIAFARTDGKLLVSGESAATKPVKYLALA